MAETHRGFFAWLQDNARILLSIALVLFLLFAVYSYSKRTENVQYAGDENDSQSAVSDTEDGDQFVLDEEITNAVLGEDTELTGSGGGLDEGIESSETPNEIAQAETDAENEVEIETEAGNEAETEVETETSQTSQQIVEQKVMQEEGMIVVAAGSGDGMTHLARRATAQHITQNNIDYLDAAQKVYIEDYLRKQVTQVNVLPGTEISFSNEAIATAIQRAQDLSEVQRANLAKYAARVSSFQ